MRAMARGARSALAAPALAALLAAAALRGASAAACTCAEVAERGTIDEWCAAELRGGGCCDPAGLGNTTWQEAVCAADEKLTRVIEVPARRNPLDRKMYDGGFDPESRDYWASLAAVSLPMFAIAALVIVASVLTLITRLVMMLTCSEKCGFFLKPREEGYSKAPTFFLKLFLLGAVGIAGIGAFLAMGFTAKLGDDLSDFSSIAVAAFNSVKDDVTAVDAAFNVAFGALPETERAGMADAMDDIGTLKETVDDLSDDVEDYEDRLDTIFGYFTQAGLGIAAVTAAIMGMAALLSLFNKGKWLNAVVPFSVLFNIVAWIIFGALFLLYTFIDDSCVAFDTYCDDRCACETYESTLSQVLPCPEASEVEGVIQDARTLINDLFETANAKIDDGNAQGAVVAPTCEPVPLIPVPYATCDFGCTGEAPEEFVTTVEGNKTTAVAAVEEAYTPFVCPGDEVTQDCLAACKTLVEECDPAASAAECPMDYVTLVDQVGAAYEVIDVLPTVDDLLRCAFVAETFGAVVANHCDGSGLSASLEKMWQSFACLSAGMIIATVVCLIGIKRFRGNYDNGDGIYPRGSAGDPMKL